jgi:hypothetical protein
MQFHRVDRYGPGSTRGTIFVIAHGRTEAFDENDARLMTMLADFAAMGYRQQKQQARHIVQERAAAVAQMANQLAHEINNSLQSMTNTAYLIAEGTGEQDPLRFCGNPRGPILSKRLIPLPLR